MNNLAIILLICDKRIINNKIRSGVVVISLIIPIMGLLACTLPQPGVIKSSQSVRASCNCEGGAFPSELTINYQSHYLAMVIDSYLVNQQLVLVQERLKTFTAPDKIKALAEQSVAYAANERTDEVQLINELAVTLGAVEDWNSETIESVAAELAKSPQYQGDDVRKQALNDFFFQLTGVILIQ